MKPIKQYGKRFAAACIAALLCAALPPSGVRAAIGSSGFYGEWDPVIISGTCGENLTWTLDGEGKLTISGTGDMTDYAWPGNVPWYYDYSEQVKTVVIEDGVTRIGDRAFYCCENLTSVTIPEGVTGIGDIAFYECEDLTSITIPASVTSIGWGAFENCASLTGVTLGGSLASIDTSAFSGCENLASVTIGASVTDIGEGAFSDCASLAAITVSEENAAYKSADGVLFTKDGKTLLCYPAGKSGTTYTIGDGVTDISGAFAGCANLTTVTIPEGVTDIGDSTFARCSSLTEAAIPDGVTMIGSCAFEGCGSLASVTIGASVTYIENGAFDGCTSLADVYYGGTQEEWNAIWISSNNEALTEDATIHVQGETPAVLPGDVNGDGSVNAKDRMTLSRYLAGWDGYVIDPAAADVNGDGTVNAKDRMVLSRHLAGWDGYETLPYTK